MKLWWEGKNLYVRTKSGPEWVAFLNKKTFCMWKDRHGWLKYPVKGTMVDKRAAVEAMVLLEGEM